MFEKEVFPSLPQKRKRIPLFILYTLLHTLFPRIIPSSLVPHYYILISLNSHETSPDSPWKEYPPCKARFLCAASLALPLFQKLPRQQQMMWFWDDIHKLGGRDWVPFWIFRERRCGIDPLLMKYYSGGRIELVMWVRKSFFSCTTVQTRMGKNCIMHHFNNNKHCLVVVYSPSPGWGGQSWIGTWIPWSLLVACLILFTRSSLLALLVLVLCALRVDLCALIWSRHEVWEDAIHLT